jgi:Fis family transcriptional regulator
MHNELKGLVDKMLSAGISLEEATELLERSMIQGALVISKGKHSAASKQLGIHRNTLQRKAVQYELEPKRTRARRKPITREARTRRRNTGVA